MPQMFRYCGQRFQVYKRAHKTCDTVSGALCRPPHVAARFISVFAATARSMAAVRPPA